MQEMTMAAKTKPDNERINNSFIVFKIGCNNNKKKHASNHFIAKIGGATKTADPGRMFLSGSPLRVGGGLLSHAFAQYHRRCGA